MKTEWEFYWSKNTLANTHCMGEITFVIPSADGGVKISGMKFWIRGIEDLRFVLHRNPANYSSEDTESFSVSEYTTGQCVEDGYNPQKAIEKSILKLNKKNLAWLREYLKKPDTIIYNK